MSKEWGDNHKRCKRRFYSNVEQSHIASPGQSLVFYEPAGKPDEGEVCLAEASYNSREHRFIYTFSLVGRGYYLYNT